MILNVIVDTREQCPFLFENLPVSVLTSTLRTGDYSVLGYEGKICIERKSLSDLAGCMTKGRQRFEREMYRMAGFESAAVVVEEPLQNIRRGEYRSKLNPVSFEQSILSFMIRFRVPFLFGQNRTHAEFIAFNCMRHYWNSKNPESEKIPYIPLPSMAH